MVPGPEVPAEVRVALRQPSRRSWSLYSRGAVCVYLIDGYAPAAVLLGVERGLANDTVGLYSAAMGLGILLGGFIAVGLASVLTLETETWLAILAASIGIGIMAAGSNLVITLLGTGMMGMSVAVGLTSIQSLISDRDGPRGLSESSGFGELFGMVAPFTIGLSVLIGLTWRGGLLVVPVAGAVVYLAWRVRHGPKAKTADPLDDIGLGGGRFSSRSWAAWLCGTLLAGAEFAIVLWLPGLLQLTAHIRIAVGVALVSLLLAGMAIGRLLAGRIRLHGNLDRVLGWSVLLTLLSFAVLWFTSSGVVAIVSVAAMGLAMSVHYPVAFARLIASAPGATNLASARSASGLGLSMLVFPPLLGLLSAGWGLRWATLVFPAILIAVFVTIRRAPVDGKQR